MTAEALRKLRELPRYRVWIEEGTQIQHWERETDGEWIHAGDLDAALAAVREAEDAKNASSVAQKK